MTDDNDAIFFYATVAKVQTMIDGGIRLTLDLQQPTPTESVMELMNNRKPGIVLHCAAVPVDVEAQKEKESEQEEYGL